MSKPLYDSAQPASAHFDSLIQIVPGGTVSKAILDARGVRQILFAMDHDQELTEHTSPALATVQVISGALWVRVGQQEFDLQESGWVLMPPNVPHAVKAKSSAKWLLTMIKPPAA
jgi:quercetin dioxygenase-like cupin family protein